MIEPGHGVFLSVQASPDLARGRDDKRIGLRRGMFARAESTRELSIL
ncbi:hypothetical protein HMPREF9404_3730 [Eggerthella sp. HGA1]|nr:hypothetical protein HMPREF9404_3730 [Eggerthella sp. HGA1]